MRVATPEAYNERVVYTEVVFQALAGAGAMSFISVFLVRLDAPNWLVGLYTSLPALVTALAVLPMGAFVQRQRDLVATVSWARMGFRTAMALFGLLPILPMALAPYVLVGARSLIAIPGTVLNVSVTTLWGQITTPQRRPRMLSTRMAIHGLVGAAIGFGAGQWLDATPYPRNYQVLFSTLFFAGLGSVLVLRRLRLPEVSAQQVAARPKADLREMLALIRSTARFRRYSVAAFVFRMGMSMPSALFSIYRVRTLGASDAWIGILLTVERLVSVVAYFALGRLLQRPGFRRWLWVSALGAGLYPLTMAMAKTPEMLLVPSFIVGIVSAGVNIYLTNTLLQVSPEETRPLFISVNSFLANLTAFGAPMLGTVLADGTHIRIALGAAALLRVVGGLVFWRLGVGGETRRSAQSAEPGNLAPRDKALGAR